ncbi:transmembrane protein 53-like [Lolium rigidum]|uniref:transmembrane protein 53-like n=1 Tax=Lolium rigidum TaxID=89674 RepID=UPI001F5E16D4|nr:transmembrane protein 53-like [Lolium rigidum]
MAFFSAPLHRPLSAMAVAAFAAVTSIELPARLSHHHMLVDTNAGTVMPLPPSTKPESAPPLPSTSALSGLQFFPRNHHQAAFDLAAKAPVASLPVINMVYQYARFTKAEGATAAVPSLSTDTLYRWHLPHPGGRSGSSDDRSQTVVVLLGWLGSKQKHLKRYAEWYTSRGFHAVTFTLPMSDIVSYNVRGKAEKNVEMLSEHLADWVREEDGKKIVFHTFSNTGWLCYGVILENLQRQDPSAVHKIKGSIVDSAPVAVPDSQVWALGFSAAIMKKHSVATKGAISNDTRSDVLVVESQRDLKPAATEAVLLSALEKFFDVVLNYPAINRRLSGVMEILSSNQPNCPQLYIYSSADRVIPAKSVESFVESQRKAGCEVRSCDFVSSPHVDHYRSNPGLYTSELTKFLEDCVLTRQADESSSSLP